MAGKRKKSKEQRKEEEGDQDSAHEHTQHTKQAEADEKLRVYLPGMDLEDGEELQADPAAYTMLHSLSTEWPCLSFDVLRDYDAPAECHTYPQSAWIVAGTQTDGSHNNQLMIMKWSNLTRTGGFTEEEEAAMAENGEDDGGLMKGEPSVDIWSCRHPGACNRVRAWQQPQKSLVASWSDQGAVHIWDCHEHVSVFVSGSSHLSPVFSIKHSTEGYALAWSSAGSLLSGDCRGDILLTDQCSVKSSLFKGHSGSVEDLQWSPSEANVFASCSCDRTVRIWDERTGKQISSWGLHDSDINVLSWNPRMSYLLATGADDGALRVWDMRMLMSGGSACTPVANFSWHRDAITSLEWHPTDSSVLAASGADHQLTLWDLAVERDDDQLVKDGGSLEDEVTTVPPQLLFIHQGQADIKELHWHPQLPGTIVSTASDSFNIFRTISV